MTPSETSIVRPVVAIVAAAPDSRWSAINAS